MPLSPRNLSIGAALIFSVALIGTAYVLSSPYGALNRADAGSSEELLRAYAEKDSDADGLFDWQEALYDTDPENPESVQAGMLDAEAVATGLVAPKFISEPPTFEPPSKDKLDAELGPAPAAGSLTEEFSQTLIQTVLQAGSSQTIDPGAQDQLIKNLMADFSVRAAQRLESSYRLSDIVRSDNTTIEAYAAAVERAVTNHTLDAGSADPVPFMEALVMEEDESARAGIERLASSYETILQGLLATPVPSSLQTQHLSLVRSYDTLVKSMRVTAQYEKDPLAVLGALAVFPPSARAVLEAGAEIGRALVASSGEPAPGEPGSMLVQVMRFMDSL